MDPTKNPLIVRRHNCEAPAQPEMWLKLEHLAFCDIVWHYMQTLSTQSNLKLKNPIGFILRPSPTQSMQGRWQWDKAEWQQGRPASSIFKSAFLASSTWQGNITSGKKVKRWEGLFEEPVAFWTLTGFSIELGTGRREGEPAGNVTSCLEKNFLAR